MLPGVVPKSINCLLIFGSLVVVEGYDRRKEDRVNNGEYDRLEKHCYSFTWIGEQTDNMVDPNTRPSCDNYWPTHLCTPPLVATKPGDNAQNGPDINDLVNVCNTVPTDGAPACNATRDLLCDLKNDRVCVKYTKYTSGTDTPVYWSAFCGTAADQGWNNVAVTSGCHRQNDYEDGDIEVCFCTTDRCNLAQAVTSTWLLPLAITTLLLAAP